MQDELNKIQNKSDKNFQNKQSNEINEFVATDYDADDLDVLAGIEAVRLRPGMYVGGKDEKAMHHLVWEITDNSVDEAIAGHCDTITLTLDQKNNIMTIEDNGRGMPINTNAKTGLNGIDIIFTQLHGGGKFNGKSYQNSGGLHGVGATVTNFLSEFLNVSVKRGGNIYKRSYLKGVATEKELLVIKDENQTRTGTIVEFKPDSNFFETIETKEKCYFNPELIKSRLFLTSCLNKGVKLIFKNIDSNETEIFLSENGLIDIIKKEIKNESEENLFWNFEYFSEDRKMICDFSFAYEKELDSKKEYLFVNSVKTPLGGQHLIGARTAISKIVHDYAKEYCNFNGKLDIDSDILSDTHIAISIKMPDPLFSSQTKEQLVSPEARTFMYNAIKEKLGNFFEENKKDAKTFIEKCIREKEIREKVNKLKNEIKKEKSGKRISSDLLSKLASAESKNPVECELFIVEGDSAGGSAKQGRNRKNQAVLPLKGKIINAIKQDSGKVNNSQEVQILFEAIGTGFGEEFDIEKIQYHKIIILTDADVDGAHICTLLFANFYENAYELLQKGHIYIAHPPLFVIKHQRGKEVKYEYIMTNEELLSKYPNGIPKSVEMTRFKGLGEMNPEQLWETTMNPETRSLSKVVLSENLDDDEKSIQGLMGGETDYRKVILEENKEKFKELF